MCFHGELQRFIALPRVKAAVVHQRKCRAELLYQNSKRLICEMNAGRSLQVPTHTNCRQIPRITALTLSIWRHFCFTAVRNSREANKKIKEIQCIRNMLFCSAPTLCAHDISSRLNSIFNE